MSEESQSQTPWSQAAEAQYTKLSSVRPEMLGKAFGKMEDFLTIALDNILNMLALAALNSSIGDLVTQSLH